MEQQKQIEELEQQLQALDPQKASVPLPASVPAQTSAPTPDFEDFCLWHTWKYGKNRGAGDFGKWKGSEGVMLTQAHDERLLKRIADHKGGDCTDDLLVRYYEAQLSWNYAVGPQWRNRDVSFIKLD